MFMQIEAAKVHMLAGRLRQVNVDVALKQSASGIANP
jgi:hypothetical protein